MAIILTPFPCPVVALHGLQVVGAAEFPASLCTLEPSATSLRAAVVGPFSCAGTTIVGTPGVACQVAAPDRRLNLRQKR
eukprot:1341846-Ditylum_brightwellii.AAC.1